MENGWIQKWVNIKFEMHINKDELLICSVTDQSYLVFLVLIQKLNVKIYFIYDVFQKKLNPPQSDPVMLNKLNYLIDVSEGGGGECAISAKARLNRMSHQTNLNFLKYLNRILSPEFEQELQTHSSLY